MLADKISTISTDKVFRRIKDVIDLYYFSKVLDFDKNEVLQTMQKSGKALNDFNGFLHKKDDLHHSYEKFRFTGDVDKPSFENMYDTVKLYIKEFLPEERL